MGFVNDIKKVIRELPQERQTLFFSATMPPEIAQLANSLLYKPVEVAVAPVSSTAEKIEQHIYMVHKGDKQKLLEHLLNEHKLERTLVFTRTKHGADRIAKELNKANIKADALHGNKTQQARQRALLNFKTGRLRVLVATDIAARGIDVDSLSHVINYDLPNVPETYVHRIGRTGRAGMEGIAFSFCDAEERAYLKDIQKLTGLSIPVVEAHPFPMRSRATQPGTESAARNGGHNRQQGQRSGNRNTPNQPRRPNQHQPRHIQQQPQANA
jgi:ATP-dependent RNA helicase RhlE